MDTIVTVVNQVPETIKTIVDCIVYIIVGVSGLLNLIRRRK